MSLISVTNYLKQTNHEEERLVATSIANHEAGYRVHARKRRRVYVQQQERLHHLCQDYVNQARDLGEFLRAVGHQIRFDD